MRINSFPLVSVAIITFNQKEFLKECIESVLNQTYSNFQIIVADDGSKDGTQDLLKNYALNYPNKFILCLSQNNEGITRNSNKAHFACEGKYIMWMGGDDIMLPGKITSQVDFMEMNENCSICYHNLDVFDSETNRTMRLMNNKYNSYEGEFLKVVDKGVFNGACSTMVRRSKTPKKGFDERIPIASDWLYYMETLLNGGEIRYIDKVLGRYRRHSGNVTNYLSDPLIGQIDHLNSCNILLTKTQKNKELIFKYYLELIRNLRIYDKKNYSEWLFISTGLNKNFKSIVLWILHILTFRIVKK